MCGIAGFTHRNGARDPDRIWEITRSIAHRGPDEQNVWEDSGVSLGAVRLKIIELSQGQQPMLSPDGDTVLAFNGEIYNHLELRQELEQKGHVFASRCDTETLLHAFLEWDTAAFAKLRGMFAAAFWSQSQQRLVLVRDRMGIKPLYIAERHGELYFGSEVKTILAHPAIDRRLSPAGLHHFLSMNYVPQPATLVEGIEKLAPGHWMEWREGRATTQAYWKLEFAPEPRMNLDGSQRGARRSAARFGPRASALRRSAGSVVQRRPGFLDHRALRGPASPRTAEDLFRFLSRAQVRREPYFREVARHYGTDHHEFNLDRGIRALADAIEQFAYYSDEPSADAGAVPVWFLLKMTRGR